MATMPPTELLDLWKEKELTIEMSIGHILQNLVAQQTEQKAAQQTLRQLCADVDRLITHTPLPPIDKRQRKPPKPNKAPDPE